MDGNNRFVAGAGNLNIDLIFSGLSSLPAEGEELYAKGFSMALGGGTPAVMIHLHRLGVPVALMTAWGDDDFSRLSHELLLQHDITPINLSQGDATLPLSVSISMLTPTDRTFVSYTDGFPCSKEVADLIYRYSRGATISVINPLFPDVYERLHDDGTTLILDTGWKDDLSLEKYRRLLEIADYFMPNRREALKITGAKSPEDAAVVLSQFFSHVIVKLDQDGCLLYADGEIKTFPPVMDAIAKDATGAGDAFLAGFIYGLYHNYAVEDCVLFGNLTGGRCVTAYGCLTAYYTEEELLRRARMIAKTLH